MAFLVFLPAAARARIVASHLGGLAPHRPRDGTLEPVGAVIQDHIDERGARFRGKALKAAIKTAEDFGFEKEAQELRTYLAAPAPARQAR